MDYGARFGLTGQQHSVKAYLSPWRRKISATSSLADFGGTDQSLRHSVRRAGSSCNRSRDLGVGAVEERLLWPSSTWMIRISVPFSSKCVAKEVPERMDRHRHPLVHAGRARRAAGRIQHLRWTFGVAAGKQPALRLPPVVSGSATAGSLRSPFRHNPP